MATHMRMQIGSDTHTPTITGASNRMRFSADLNVQKALGMVTDLFGAIMLANTLWTVRLRYQRSFQSIHKAKTLMQKSALR